MTEKDPLHLKHKPPRACSKCGGRQAEGEFSSTANFGITRTPHFVTSFGWMQVRYERSTEVKTYMCLDCGYIEFYGESPLAVLDPEEREAYLQEKFPEMKGAREEKKSEKRAEEKVTLPDDDPSI